MQIESLQIHNFSVFQNALIEDIPKIAVFIGQNGSGKTIFFDVFGFLHDCLSTNVRSALAMRGGFREVVSREQKGDIGFKIEFRSSPNEPRITYELTIGLENGSIPVVKKEKLRLLRDKNEAPWKILDFSLGEGIATQDDLLSSNNVQKATEKPLKLSAPDILAIKGLGQFKDFPAIASLRRLIEDWYVSDFHIEDARNRQAASYSESLSTTGDNLAQVAKFLHDNHPERFAEILKAMHERVLGVDGIEAKLTEDGYVALRFQDRQFKNPFSSKFVSDGTIKMFTYLVLLSDPSPHALLCVEEPENKLYPQLLPQLAEEFRSYSNTGGQVFISTHSPDFLNAISLDELFCLVKDNGYTRIARASEFPLIKSLYNEGDLLGDLWSHDVLLSEAKRYATTPVT